MIRSPGPARDSAVCVVYCVATFAFAPVLIMGQGKDSVLMTFQIKTGSKKILHIHNLTINGRTAWQKKVDLDPSKVLDNTILNRKNRGLWNFQRCKLTN